MQPLDSSDGRSAEGIGDPRASTGRLYQGDPTTPEYWARAIDELCLQDQNLAAQQPSDVVLARLPLGHVGASFNVVDGMSATEVKLARCGLAFRKALLTARNQWLDAGRSHLAVALVVATSNMQTRMQQLGYLDSPGRSHWTLANKTYQPIDDNTVEDTVNNNDALEEMEAQVAKLKAELAAERTNVQRLEAGFREAASSVADGGKMAVVAAANIAARDKIIAALGDSCPEFLKEGLGNDAALAVPPLAILLACEIGPDLGLPVPAGGVDAARSAAHRALTHAGFAGANGIGSAVWDALAPLFALYMMAGQAEAPTSTQLPGPDLVEATSQVKVADKLDA